MKKLVLLCCVFTLLAGCQQLSDSAGDTYTNVSNEVNKTTKQISDIKDQADATKAAIDDKLKKADTAIKSVQALAE
ncbi:hypothetical protein GF340_00015 [Candidatus Peregrinibacteria bacterium]|nr:hypothetical protein [Candidatus Peregrinibacteria bacterium]